MQQQKMQKEEVKAPIYLQPSPIAESPFLSRELVFFVMDKEKVK